MQFSTLLIATFAAGMASADWTIQKYTRTCNAADTSCTHTFGIQTNAGQATVPCSVSAKGTPASHASTSGTCGAYSVTSNWSGQFGPGNGFTTFAVTDRKYIVYPAYSDSEAKNATAVTPDKSYKVYTLN